MDTTIYANDYHDIHLDDIKQMVQGKDDNVPFVLFPVKIETRFMQVDNPILQPWEYIGVLEQLHILENYLWVDLKPLPPTEVLGRLGRILTQLDDIKQEIAGINELSQSDKLYLNETYVQLSGQIRHVSSEMSTLKWEAPEQMHQLRQLNVQLNNAIEPVASGLKAVQVANQTKYSGAKDLLDQLSEINANLTKLAQKDLRATERTQKRQLFAYIDRRFKALDEGVKGYYNARRRNNVATTVQIQSIKNQLDAFDKLANDAVKNLQHLQSEYKKAVYQTALKQTHQQLKSIQSDIQEKVMPKMQMANDLKTADARDVYREIRQVWRQLKRLNSKPIANYAQVKSSRTALYKKLHSIREDVHKVVEGTEREFQALENAWKETDAEIEKYKRNIKKVHVKTSGQKGGISRAITHLSNEYQSDLAGLKSVGKSGFPRLDNARLEKSALAFNTTTDELWNISGALIDTLRGRTATEDVQKELEKVNALNRQLKAVTDDIHVLPEKSLKEMQEASKLMGILVDLSISEANDNSGPDIDDGLIENAKIAVSQIQQNIDAQHSDAIDRKDHFYDDLRTPLVFATKTQTEDELWVRIFPDDIAIHTHETELTEDERDAGQAYWFEVLAAEGDYNLKLAAWRAIATAYGPQRAAWIVKSLKPIEEYVQSFGADIQQVELDVQAIEESLSSVNNLMGKVEAPDALFNNLSIAYAHLEKAKESMQQLQTASPAQMNRLQRVLVRTQSRLNGAIAAAQNMPLERPEITARNKRTLSHFINRFNDTTRFFGETKVVKPSLTISEDLKAKLFPQVPIRSGSWTKAPHARVMPDRFVVLTMREGVYRQIKVGKKLPEDGLIVGIDPANFENSLFSYDEEGNLNVEESIKWLTDYREAEKIGMAISVPIQEIDLENGFDKVLVLGVKDTTKQEGRQFMEELIDNHHYLPEGAAFMPVGMPTNNTESGQSGYRSSDDDFENSFAVERNNEIEEELPDDTDYPTDGHRFALGLGVNYRVVRNLENHERHEVSEALNMNKALFDGTVGSFMDEALDQLFTFDNTRRTRTFFNNYVSARSFVPPLRVGTQPYGFLPTTAFSRFHATDNDEELPWLTKEDFENTALIQPELERRFDIRLKEALNHIHDMFTDIRKGEVEGVAEVKHLGNVDPDEPQDHFMKVLGAHATSAERFYRYGMNVAARKDEDQAGGFAVGFDTNADYSPNKAATKLQGLIWEGRYCNTHSFADEEEEWNNAYQFLGLKFNRIQQQFKDARIYSMRFLEAKAQLLGDVVDSRPLSEVYTPPSNPLSGSLEERYEAKQELGNWIDWLLDTNPWDVHQQNVFSELNEENISSGLPSKSLAFLLLRHSVLSTYATTILDILEYEGLVPADTRKKIGATGHYNTRVKGYYDFVTKWTYLFSTFDYLDGTLGNKMDEANVFYKYIGNNYLNHYLSPERPHFYRQYPFYPVHEPYMEHLREVKNAVRKLKDLPTERVERLLTEHLDLCSYRLDAWRLGLVNKRLTKQREAQAYGSYIGAFGWVEDLRKGGERQVVAGAELPSGLWKNGDPKVYRDADNEGFIHAPSLNHAITAAILRAGYISNKEAAKNQGVAHTSLENELSVNLSSERVRMALNILQGIRVGQEAAEMLGYQFERGLHERYLHIGGLELDKYIYDFRQLFPLTPLIDDPSVVNPEAQGEEALLQVVHGMDLLEEAQHFIKEVAANTPEEGASLYESLKANEAQWWQYLENANLSQASAAEKDAMLRETDRMANAFDALGDLCLSESVYQVAKGNHIRASAILDKLAKGDLPQELQITDIPRSGAVVTHKTGLFLEPVSGIDIELTGTAPNNMPLESEDLTLAVAAVGAAAAGWDAAFTPRALADPTLNKWVGERIGDPTAIKCLVAYTLDEILHEVTVSLAQLELQPLDVLHLFGTANGILGSELDARIAEVVRSGMTLPEEMDANADAIMLQIKYTERGADWQADDISIYEKSGLIQTLRQVISDCGVLAADHLAIPGEEEVPDAEVRNQHVDELYIRISNAASRLHGFTLDFQALTYDAATDTELLSTDIASAENFVFTEDQLIEIRALLKKASLFGIPGSVPEQTVSDDLATGRSLLAALEGAYAAAIQRLTETDAYLVVAANASEHSADARVEALVEAAKSIFGKAFKVVPHFTLRSVESLTTQLALPEEKGLLRHVTEPFPMETWNHSISRVRKRMANWDLLGMHLDLFHQELPDKKALQLPFALDDWGNSLDYWLGTMFPEGYFPEEDKLSLILMNSQLITDSPDAPKSGLLIDEWVEIIPSETETTSIAFNYDQPDAKAPNTVLLAVTPQETGSWDWEDLVQTLCDTLEMAKNRAVEPEHLEKTTFGQILPGIITEVVPINLLEEGENSSDAQGNPLGRQVVTDFGVNNETVEETE